MLMRALVLLTGWLTIGGAEAQVVEAQIVEARVVTAAPPANPTTEPVPSGNPLRTIPLGSLTATRERPLFSPSRRPPPPVVATRPPPPPPASPPKPAEPEKPQLSLVGTVVGETGEGIGLFMNLADIKPLRLKVGEDHNGWVLRDVLPRQVVLEKGQQNAVLELQRRDVGKAGSVPPPVAQANRKPDPAVDDVAATSSSPDPSPDNTPKATGGFSLPPPTGVQAVATIAVQPPVFTPPPPPVNPFEKARFR